jgi:hypothetical protein
LPKQRNDPLDEVEFKLTLGQPQDRPARQHGFEILLGILRVTRPAAMSAAAGDEDPALDFNQGPASHVCEVGAPPTGSVELHFPIQRRTLGHPPEEEKPGFELGACHLTGQPSQPADGKLPVRGNGK